MFARLVIVALAAGVLAEAAPAQPQQIQWMPDVQEGVALAQKSKRPIMFYVIGKKDDRPDVEDQHRKCFQNPVVLRQASRFVPIRLLRAQHRDLLKTWPRVSEQVNLDVIFATPGGEYIDQHSASGVANPDTFANKMYLVFNAYRSDLFTRELKPKLDDANASPADVKQALDLIESFMIPAADSTLVSLLDRDKLDTGTRKRIYKVLATLSTKASVDVLLARAPGDRDAADALNGCTPAAADKHLLPLLTEEASPERILIYKALVKICDISKPKPDKFWDSPNPKLIKDEINRVRELVRGRAQRWEAQNEYR